MRTSYHSVLPVVIINCLCVFSVTVPAIAQPASENGAISKAAFHSYEQSILSASKRFSVPASWIRAVITVESGWNARAVSPAGAIGLMQVMPGTYQDLRRQYGLGADPFAPHDNIMAGTAYLKQMHRQFGRRGFLAAYNAGPGRYQKHLKGAPLPPETIAYVAKLEPILDVNPQPRIIAKIPAVASAWAIAPLFVNIAANKPLLSDGQRLLTALSSRSIGLLTAGKSATAVLPD